MKCPACGADSSGNFCAQCGASLASAQCANCGADLVPGARFCTKCGTAVATGAASRRQTRATSSGSNLAWYLAAAPLIVLIVVLALPMLTGGDGADPDATVPLGNAPFAPGATGGGTPPPLTGTPREQADRLFNRIMSAQDAGDTTTAKFFSTMGIQAYEMAEPLDHDGMFHLAMIQNVAGNFAAARATAERILADRPNHLLALAAAAEAAERAGDAAAARSYHQRFLAAYDTEIASGLQEYQDHAAILPGQRETARRVTGS